MERNTNNINDNVKFKAFILKHLVRDGEYGDPKFEGFYWREINDDSTEWDRNHPADPIEVEMIKKMALDGLVTITYAKPTQKYCCTNCGFREFQNNGLNSAYLTDLGKAFATSIYYEDKLKDSKERMSVLLTK